MHRILIEKKTGPDQWEIVERFTWGNIHTAHQEAQRRADAATKASGKPHSYEIVRDI